MPFGVFLRRLLPSSAQGRLWRGLSFWQLLGLGFFFIPLLLWHNLRQPLWAQSAIPRLLISEIHPMPKAVGDQMGEWIEIVNLESEAVNLHLWSLVNGGNAEHIFATDLWLAPGAYVVFTRHGDPAQNGGVQPFYVYPPFSIANANEQISLRDPNGVVVDSIAWGEGTALVVTRGASLERFAPEASAPWVVAHSSWSGSAGDLGSPGAPYSPPPTATPLPTPPPAVAPRLFLSEIMANPEASSDDLGEWVELYNGDSVPIQLNGWVLADQEHDRAPLTGDLWVAPGGYVVVARATDPAQNGGIPSLLGYEGLQLANEEDELLLITPWGVVADQVIWGEGTLRISAGASLERSGFDPTAPWMTAHSPWAGSLGDFGSPELPYSPAPQPTPQPTATATATASPTAPPAPTATLPPTPSPTALPAAWNRRAVPSPLTIAQLSPQGSDEEYVVLANWTDAPVALAGWRLGDAEFPGDREGLMVLPPDVVLAPRASWVVARNANLFRTQWGRAPDAEWGHSDPTLPQLLPDSILAGSELALADEGDELFLLDPEGNLADAVAWKDGQYAALGLLGHLNLPSQNALYQAPDVPYFSVSDLRHRFIILPPNPFNPFTLPTASSRQSTALDGGMLALWGSLGAVSTFSAEGTTPPHLLLAAAKALGLDFIAIADSDRAPTDVMNLQSSVQSGLPIFLPAWRWQHPDGTEAIVYSDHMAVLLGWGEFIDYLNEENVLAQMTQAGARNNQRTPLLAADEVSAPGGLNDLQSIWQSLETPLLPAGNTTPLFSGGVPLQPRYTGVAATAPDSAAILEAMAARRGWLTSSPGLWLTLRTDDGAWMGSTIAPANELTVHLAYGDSSGANAGLALWQGDQLVRQLDLPPQDGRWSVTLPAAPGTMLYAVATQLDGDFAISAPLYIGTSVGGRVQINEVLPAPNSEDQRDYNGDGEINSEDEFVELFNSGSAPLSLAGYSLADDAALAGGHRFTFGPNQFIGAGERLLLWHTEVDLGLNDDGDSLQLLDANGTVIDSIAWEERENGASLSRVSDGGEWQMQTPPTPGEANQNFPPQQATAPEEDEDEEEPPDDNERNPEPAVLAVDVSNPTSPNFGQTSGPPASVALAKVRGLESVVEFRAQVTVPPGLFPSVIYVAEAALDANGAPLPIAGLGLQLYLKGGDFIAMNEGDWLLVRGGVLKSFRGEMEIQIEEPGQAWPYEVGTPLAPLPVTISAIGESLEARLVTFTGVVTGWQGDSIYLSDPATPDAPAIRVTVRSSLGWKRPYVHLGEQFSVTGIVSQFGTAAPWNDGYRVLIRYQSDLVKLAP